MRKHHLVAMAVALEEPADDEKESGLLQCKRTVWVDPWLTIKYFGMQNQLHEKLYSPAISNSTIACCVLTSSDFTDLLALIEPKIVRQDTVMRSSVSAKTHLAES
ncbi:hypothetical protein MRX96_001678 [Rhipicephalus microplus]